MAFSENPGALLENFVFNSLRMETADMIFQALLSVLIPRFYRG
jgi:hypothetical protein